MKRIIKGLSYNTDTSTKLAAWGYFDHDYNVTGKAELYQTRGGAFFSVSYTPIKKGDPLIYFKPMTRKQVDDLITKTDNLEILNDYFKMDAPEAEEEVTVSTTLYVRLPESLKRQAEEAAKGAGVSLNAWVIRCLENCGRAASAKAIDSENPLSVAETARMTIEFIESHGKPKLG